MNIIKVFCLILINHNFNYNCECEFDNFVREQWNYFKLEHLKEYSSQIEEGFRFKVFLLNANKVIKHNQRYELGLESFEMKLNKFADMFDFEVSKELNGLNYTNFKKSWEKYEGAPFNKPVNLSVPAYMNWTELGGVTHVKDQGFCGSCWAFASTGSLEGQIFRLTNKLISLSEQNLIDCSESYGNNGCYGGWMIYSYNYIKDNNGIDTEKSYPYDEEYWFCRYNPKTIGGTDKGYIQLQSNNETELMRAIAIYGPVSVAIDASHTSFHLYSKGVYYEPDCNDENVINHAVLVVGYGTDKENGLDYWLVKNSWGKNWGENGYIKMARNVNNNCFIASYPSFPIV